VKKKRKILGIFKKCYFFAHFPKTGMTAAVSPFSPFPHFPFSAFALYASGSYPELRTYPETPFFAMQPGVPLLPVSPFALDATGLYPELRLNPRCRLSADILCDGESDRLRKV
jgi:hypothetical protein